MLVGGHGWKESPSVYSTVQTQAPAYLGKDEKGGGGKRTNHAERS